MKKKTFSFSFKIKKASDEKAKEPRIHTYFPSNIVSRNLTLKNIYLVNLYIQKK